MPLISELIAIHLQLRLKGQGPHNSHFRGLQGPPQAPKIYFLSITSNIGLLYIKFDAIDSRINCHTSRINIYRIRGHETVNYGVFRGPHIPIKLNFLSISSNIGLLYIKFDPIDSRINCHTSRINIYRSGVIKQSIMWSCGAPTDPKN